MIGGMSNLVDLKLKKLEAGLKVGRLYEFVLVFDVGVKGSGVVDAVG